MPYNVFVKLLGGQAHVGVMPPVRSRKKEEVLSNDGRRTVYEFVQDNPGVYLQQIADHLDMAFTSVRWHLQKLSDAGLVKSTKLKGLVIYYSTERGIRSRREAVANALMDNDNSAAILEFVANNPGTHQRKIAQSLDLKRGTTRWHLSKLTSLDIIDKERNGQANSYRLTEKGETLADVAEIDGNGARA